MAPNIAGFSTLRARSYVFRLPIFTRLVIALILLFWVLTLQSAWDVRQWGSLIPSTINFQTMYRTNTFPLIHLNLLHVLLNLIALTPLMDRFESENGTLVSLALFFGPLSTIPALLYVGIERLVLMRDTGVMGASLWVFLLMGVESIRTYRANPYLMIASYRIPTWTMPLVMILIVAALIPNTSTLGHLCGLGVGYVFGLGYLKFLAPPEKALRWVEGKLNLISRVPRYVSVDQKTYGRFGVLPSSNHSDRVTGTPMSLIETTQRLGS
ncbi:rhomboid protein 2 [Zalerion maritima]|uniref:rhomboid protease n=1 Tax=Zalerion maritima TaxID=339359 RepID=A0AAD5RMC7_9PEZI|nr:rhomboid protein 2 [Zalerion maritima]